MFTAKTLEDQLGTWPTPGCYWVALSGGPDSTALLHAAAEIHANLPAELRAIHVNHRLHKQSDRWQEHCVQLCKRLGVPLQLAEVEVPRQARKSPESQARQARYQAVLASMSPGDMLLTAHHADDQAETVLLQLMRGTGVEGLGGMRALGKLQHVWIGRPLLACSRDQLLNYLEVLGVTAIQDPSNSDTSIRRNFIRHEILPRLAQVWPAASAQLAKTAGHARSALTVLHAVAKSGLDSCRGTFCYELSLDNLLQLDLDRQALVLRQWVKENQLPIPHERQLQQLLEQTSHARAERAFCIRWPGVEVRRYRSLLYIMPPLEASSKDWHQPWNLSGELDLPRALGTLTARGGAGIGVQVHTRAGNASLLPCGQEHHRSLKQLFQNAGIPPWLRTRVPLVSRAGQCLAVGDLWIDQGFANLLKSANVTFRWRPGLQQWADFRKRILAGAGAV